MVIGLALVAWTAWLTPYNDSVLSNTFLAGTSFPMAAFGILILLAVPLNALLHRVRAGIPPFSAAELITIWALMMVASGIPGSGLLRMVVPQAAGYRYGATPENKWEERLGPHLRPYMVVDDKEAATEFFTGMSDAPPVPWVPSNWSIADWNAIPWGAWLRPAIGYGVLTLGVFLGYICLASIIRKQWVERERYPYPLADLPMELALESERGRGVPALFRNGPFLAATLIIVGLHCYAGLCRLHPAFGGFRFALDLQNVFTEVPWRYLPGALKYWRIHPIGVGLTYAVPTDVLFSVWFMKVFIGLQEMVYGLRGDYGGEVAFGWDPAYQCYPQLAAYLALAGWILFTGRHHFREVFRSAVGGPRPDDAEEAMPYRWAARGFLLAVGILMGWFLYSGVRFFVAATVVIVFFAIALGCSWLVCQAGQMVVAARTVPSDTLVGLFGKVWQPRYFGRQWWRIEMVNAKELAVLPLFESPFSKDLREILMPSVANLTRAADAGVSRRALLGFGALALVVSVLVAAPQKVALGYEYAAATLPDRWGFGTAATLPFDWPAGFMVRDFPTNPTNILHFITGSAFMVGCLVLRSRFLWFRLHPGGLCIAASFAGDVFWFTVFLGWLIKRALLFFGGASALKSARPIFYGMIVGDSISWAIWMIVGLVVQDPARTYAIMPL